MSTATNHHHGDIGRSGQCPDCRARNIALLANAPRHLCVFPGDNSIAIVRAWDDPLSAAWATGCNPGGAAAAMYITEQEYADVPEFELIRGDLATAPLDQVRAAMRDRECDCHTCKH